MSDDQRPDPDALLAQIRDDEQREGRGSLRIYFGSSAGVGKTYAMLVAARKLKAEGVDVLAGVVETHGRSETAALLEGLPVLPPAQIEYRGKRLAEFDLDGALARKPGLLLVDELAHSNVPGSRHAKRWQDVEELLAAGIDVYSTLNVQHLESLNDVVGGITGVVVHETLPDTFFDKADQVVLVDTPADELIERLAAGKVYLPAQAERAAKNFFRKGNLMALRELALRRTADRVEDDVQAWRSDRAITQVWKTEGALLCCIGPHEGAEHVVRSAARLAQQLAVTWHAVYVETPRLQRLDGARREGILQTVKLARELGASTAVVSAQDVPQALVDYARAQNLSKLVLGHGRASRWWPALQLARAVGELAPDIDRIEVGQSSRSRPAPVPRDAAVDTGVPLGQKLLPYLWATAVCAAATLLTHALVPFFDLANIVMVFLLAVVGTGVWFGRGPAVLAAFVNVAAFDFFFVAPRLSFAVTDVQYLLTFAVMLVVGLVVGQLTAGLRFQAQVATHRETRSRALFEAARDLSNTLTVEQALEVAQQVIAREFRAQVVIYVLGADDRLQLAPTDAAGLDLGTAQWVLDHHQPAGLGTDTLAGSAWLYLPLKATMRSRGVLALKPVEPRLPARARAAPAAGDLCRAGGDGAGARALHRRRPGRDGADGIRAAAQLAAVGSVARPAHAIGGAGRPGRHAGSEPARPGAAPAGAGRRHRREDAAHDRHGHQPARHGAHPERGDPAAQGVAVAGGNHRRGHQGGAGRAGRTPGRRAYRSGRAAGGMRRGADRARARQPAGECRQVHAGSIGSTGHRPRGRRCAAHQRA